MDHFEVFGLERRPVLEPGARIVAGGITEGG